MVVYNHHFIHFAKPLFCKHADGGRSTAYSHTFFLRAIHNGSLARLDDYRWPFIDGQFNWLSITKVQQSLASGGTLLATATCEMPHASERQHLGAIFAGSNVAYGFALRAHRIGFWSEVTVGIDLHLDAAIAKDPFSDYRDHIQALHMGRNNEWGGLVIGIGCACADCSYEVIRTTYDTSIPLTIAIEEGNY